MNTYAEVDTSRFPIIQVTFTGEKASTDNFQFYLQEVKNSYDLQSKVALIFDANNAVLPGLTYQKMQADWLKENEKMMTDYCVGTAYVISNSLIRNVLKAIFLLQKQPVPYMVCSTLEEAEAWVQQQWT